MTISDADFKRWARSGDSDVTVLAEIEFAYQTASGPATALIYLSDRPYGVGATPYIAAISKAPELERAIDLAKLGGRGSRTVGDLTLDNGNGELDFLLDVIIDGRDVSFYIGDRTWARSDFRLVMVAAVASVSADNDERITVKLRDKNYSLDSATMIGSTIASGPNEGKPKPILLGVVKNFDLTPYCLDDANLIYAFNDFAIDATFATVFGGTAGNDVRDSGLTLSSVNALATYASADISASAATDTLTTVAAHGLAVDDVIFWSNLSGGSPSGPFPGVPAATQLWVLASGLTANDFKLSLTKGGAAVDITSSTFQGVNWGLFRSRFYIDTTNATVQLSGNPAGQLTLDTYANDAAGEMLTTGSPKRIAPHRVFKYVLAHYTDLRSSQYDGTGIDALAETEAYTDGGGLGIYYGRAILDRTNVLTILDEISAATASWYGWNASGVLTVGRLDLAHIDSATPIDSLSTADIVGDISCVNQPLPFGRVILNADRNMVTQTSGIAGAVSATDRTRFGQPFESRVTTTDPAGTDYLGNWWDYHASAVDSAPMDAGLMSPVGGYGPGSILQDSVDRITALFKPWTRVARCTVPLDKYALNPGDCVSLTYPRYGLDAGKNFRVASVKPRISDKQVDLVLVTQVTPDYTSTSHFPS